MRDVAWAYLKKNNTNDLIEVFIYWNKRHKHATNTHAVTYRWLLHCTPEQTSQKLNTRLNSSINSFAAQWSLYVPHSGHYMYPTVVTICTIRFNIHNSTFCPHSVFVCFVWISEQTAIISLYNINWLVCITETECVYCAIRTGSLNKAVCACL